MAPSLHSSPSTFQQALCPVGHRAQATDQLTNQQLLCRRLINKNRSKRGLCLFNSDKSPCLHILTHASRRTKNLAKNGLCFHCNPEVTMVFEGRLGDLKPHPWVGSDCRLAKKRKEKESLLHKKSIVQSAHQVMQNVLVAWARTDLPTLAAAPLVVASLRRPGTKLAQKDGGRL